MNLVRHFSLTSLKLESVYLFLLTIFVDVGGGAMLCLKVHLEGHDSSFSLKGGQNVMF